VLTLNKIGRFKLILISLMTALLMLMVVPKIEAQEKKISPLLEKGIGQYKHENYDEALANLQQAVKDDPESSLANYYLGLDYKRLQQYKNAIPYLRNAVTFTPKIIGALVELIDCLYNVNELEEANKWIVEAEKEGIRPAQVAFLKGLVLLKEDKSEAAIASFETAKELDKTMTQSVDYQIGIAHLKSQDFRDAQKAFKSVIFLEPSSNIAQYANEYIDALVKREEAMRPWKFSFGTAWQYDDNVVLKSDDASIATNITDSADSRTTYTTNLEYNHRFDKTFGIKAQHLFYYSKQFDLGFYDTLSNTVVVQPGFTLENGLLTFPITYSHSMVDERSYLSNPAVGGVYNFMVGPSKMGQLSLKYNNKDFLWTPSTEDEDRDSNEIITNIGGYLFFAKKKGFVNLRYGFNNDWAEGNNWDQFGNRVTATVLVPVNDKLNLTVSGDFLMQRFLNTHTVFDIKREDDVSTASTLLAYKLTKDCELQMQYTHVNNDSNISIYKYARNIYSTSIQLKF